MRRRIKGLRGAMRTAFRTAGELACVAGLGLVAAGGGVAAANGLVGARAALQTLQPDAAQLDAVQPGTSRTDATVTAVKLANRVDAADLVFDLTRPVALTTFVLANPDRAIIDLQQVGFALDPQAGVPHGGRHRGGHGSQHEGRDLVKSFRFGLLAPGRSRIVIDLARPARIVSAAIRADGAAAKLVVSLAKTDGTKPDQPRTDESRTTQLMFDGIGRDGVGIGAALRSTAVPDATPTASIAPRGPSRATVVIDPGHGGPDTGASVNGVVEKDVTLAFARVLAGRLEASGRFNVVMTRASDVFIPLSERVRIARGAAAALMISVHADTLTETADVGGATVYTVSDRASDAYAATVAAKENAADAAVGAAGQADMADVNDILFDLTRQETRAYSHVFARTLVNYWKLAGRLNKNPRRAAGFVVLKAPDVPSVLLELGYLSNAGDAANLVSDEWRATAAARMADAIDAYFADQRGPAKAAAGVAIPEAPLHQASAAAATAR